MRNLQLILKSFAGVAAVTTLMACEEPHKAEPPRPAVIERTPVTPKSGTVTGAGTGAGAGAGTAAGTGTDPVVASDADVVDEGALRANQLISGAREALGIGELERALRLARLATVRAPNRA